MSHLFPPLSSLLGGETLGLEYKRDQYHQDRQNVPMRDETLAEVLMALGNAHGGTLLLGVNNTGQILGLHPDRRGGIHDTGHRVGRQFLEMPAISVQEYTAAEERVWAFHIEPAVQRPYQLNSGVLKIRKDRGTRQGPEDLTFPTTEIPQWQAQRGIHYDFSSQLLPEMLWADHTKYLNPLAVDILQRRIADGKINNLNLRQVTGLEQQLDMLGLLGTVDGHKALTNAALILLGNNDTLRERLPAHTAQFQAFAADGSLPYNLFPEQSGFEYRCLIYLATRIEELFRGIVPRRELMDGLFRIDIPAFGDDALREAVMNAFVHRDYTIAEPVIIQITTEQFTITNPGGFYRDVTPQNILFHEPCCRNQRLAQAAADIGLMEKSGRGVDRIFWDQIRFVRPIPSYAASTNDTVRLTLPGGEGSLESIRWMFDHFSGVPDLRICVVHGGLIHVLIGEGEATREALIASIPGLDADWGRRAITELINAGLITRIGHGRGQRLVLSAQFQKRLGKPEAFVHQAGLDEERLKQMILQYVESHGSVTRGEAAKLLGMKADNTVYRLLNSLVQTKQLERQGERNKARYQRVKV